MKNLISFKLAGTLTITIIVLLIIFHILLLLGVVPSDIVWGGKAADKALLIKLEIFSLVTSFIILAVICAKLQQNINVKFRKVINVGIWIIFGYFLLNIVGNLASGVTTEKLIFTPITIILSVLLFRLAIEK